MTRARCLACAAALALVLAPSIAAARGCRERSESQAVGFATCRRFGAWDYTSTWAPSLALAFFTRSMPTPREVGVCRPHGKTCSTVAPNAGVDPGGALTSYVGALDVAFLSLGPLRLGLELDLGATDRGLTGWRAGAPFRTEQLLYAAGMGSLGLSFGFSTLGFRLEGLGGGGLRARSTATTADGQPLDAEHGFPVLEGRATASVWITPWISLGIAGGYGLGDMWHAGGVLRFALLPYDGARP